MRRIAVINQKGGVGKTTTTVNLGAALARLGRKVLVCDLDPQCNLTVHLDLDPATVRPSLCELFHGKDPLSHVARPTTEPNLDVAPASIDLAGMELELVNAVGREMLLRQAFEEDARERPRRYDFILVDCPPSLGLLSLNALVACDELFVPIQAEFFALQGLSKLLEIVQLVRTRLNPALRISTMMSCRHDPSTNLSRAVIDDVRKHFGDILLQSVVRRDVKLAEAPSHGKTIFQYAPGSRGAEDYLTLAEEILALRRREAPADSSGGGQASAAARAVQAATGREDGAPAPGAATPFPPLAPNVPPSASAPRLMTPAHPPVPSAMPERYTEADTPLTDTGRSWREAR